MQRLIVLSGASGVGKTTIQWELDRLHLLKDFVCIDTDVVGVNWWDYAGTENESKFNDDCLTAAVKKAENHQLLFSTCMNPIDFYGKVQLPQSITSTFFIGMACSDAKLIERLRSRPAERMCDSDEFITAQLAYNNWFRKNANKFQLYIDNTDETVAQTAAHIAAFINHLHA